MRVSVMEKILVQIDKRVSHMYSKIRNGHKNKFIKKTITTPSFHLILNNAVELIGAIVVIALLLSLYLASGLHASWINLITHVQ